MNFGGLRLIFRIVLRLAKFVAKSIFRAFGFIAGFIAEFILKITQKFNFVREKISNFALIFVWGKIRLAFGFLRQKVRFFNTAWQKQRQKQRQKRRLALALCLVPLFVCGCYVNERGISNRYYDDCKEYYDASGTYHKDCPQNWVDIPFLTPGFKTLKPTFNFL